MMGRVLVDVLVIVETTVMGAMLMEQIDVGLFAPVPRARVPKGARPSLFGLLNSITLIIPVPDFEQMAYVASDDMLAEFWI